MYDQALQSHYINVKAGTNLEVLCQLKCVSYTFSMFLIFLYICYEGIMQVFLK